MNAVTQKKITFGLIGLIFTVLGFVFKVIYRDYIYHHQINDFGIADLAPSFFYVIGFSFLLLIELDRIAKWVILIVTSASILYESKQAITSGIIDYPDIIASVCAGLLALLIFESIVARDN